MKDFYWGLALLILSASLCCKIDHQSHQIRELRHTCDSLRMEVEETKYGF